MRFRRALLWVYFGVLTFALGTALFRPVAFQKSNTILATSELPALVSAEPFDVVPVLAAVPYTTDAVWTVLPEAKYRETIEEGRGNCSQKTFGLAWRLDRDGQGFQIVHLLPLDSFLVGGGHSLLRTRVAWEDGAAVGLVDLLRGALPLTAERLVDVSDLASGPVEDFRFEQINPAGHDSSGYFGAFLDGAVVGVISGEEVGRYFRFVESVYVPLGHARLEKIVYDGLALAFGAYPTIRVPEAERLFAGHRLERGWYRGALWMLRLAPFVLAIGAIDLLRRHRRSG